MVKYVGYAITSEYHLIVSHRNYYGKNERKQNLKRGQEANGKYKEMNEQILVLNI